MKEDRFLTGILIGIALLVVASLAIFFVRKDTQTYLLEDGPDAVVHNYIFAVQEEDYERAYTYLAEGEEKPSYKKFLRDITNATRDHAQIGDVEISGETAWVEVIFTDANGRIFVDYYDYEEKAFLIKEDGTWKIIDMGHYYWGWDWYEEQ